MVSAADIMDQVLRERGCRPRSEWTRDDWLAYLDGWTLSTLGHRPPPERDRDTPYRRVGRFMPIVLGIRKGAAA